MLFKLSFSNMKKSLKDYAVYFFTLILGVAIFYLFNAIETQTTMLKISEDTREISYMVMELLGTEYMVQSIIMTGVFILLIYGGYFVITYNSCKNMIKNI